MIHVTGTSVKVSRAWLAALAGWVRLQEKEAGEWEEQKLRGSRAKGILESSVVCGRGAWKSKPDPAGKRGSQW